jgi:hypothetical protein
MKSLVCALSLVLFAVAFPPEGWAQVLFDADQFGKVDLVPKQSAFSTKSLIETLGAQTDRFEPIAEFRDDDPIRVLGKAVGRLDILVTSKVGTHGVATCTSSLIDSDKIITNYHCVPGEDGDVIERVEVRFGYLEYGTATSQAFPVDLKPIESNKTLDYAILRVSGYPAETFGVAPLKVRRAKLNERLFLIHIPQDSHNALLALFAEQAQSSRSMAPHFAMNATPCPAAPDRFYIRKAIWRWLAYTIWVAFRPSMYQVSTKR